MAYILDQTPQGCVMRGKSLNSAWELPIPLTPPAVMTLLGSLLRNPESTEVSSGKVTIVRTASGVSFRANGGNFDIPWPHLFCIEAVVNA